MGKQGGKDFKARSSQAWEMKTHVMEGRFFPGIMWGWAVENVLAERQPRGEFDSLGGSAGGGGVSF